MQLKPHRHLHKNLPLTFDGKKLKQSLTETNGDVDILKFEDGISLAEKQENLK